MFYFDATCAWLTREFKSIEIDRYQWCNNTDDEPRNGAIAELFSHIWNSSFFKMAALSYDIPYRLIVAINDNFLFLGCFMTKNHHLQKPKRMGAFKRALKREHFYVTTQISRKSIFCLPGRILGMMTSHIQDKIR